MTRWMDYLFPSPEYELSSRPKAAKTFTIVMPILVILIIGGTIVMNWDTLTFDDVLALFTPFAIMFVGWLFIMWMRKETGVSWVPWFPR